MIVAPRVGAWIEINNHLGVCVYENQSHPVWVRGLKYGHFNFLISDETSHPVWVRGLKFQVLCQQDALFVVAPRVGAWIEIFTSNSQYLPLLSRTPCGCVD